MNFKNVFLNFFAVEDNRKNCMWGLMIFFGLLPFYFAPWIIVACKSLTYFLPAISFAYFEILVHELVF